MSTKPELTRRELLQLGAVGGLSAAWLTPNVAAASQPTPAPGQRPKNVIFMVADGMSLGVPSLAEPFSRLVRGKPTVWYELLRQPHVTCGLFETGALCFPVTDSSAAVSAWATGSQVFNGALNVLPDGTRLTPIGPLVQQEGMRVGLVTTTRITNATPAGFAAVQPSRRDEHLVAAQYLDRADVLLGGGRDMFDAALRDDQHDLLAEFAANGYAFWDHRRQVTGPEQPPKVLGLFADAHLPYTIDHRNEPQLWQRVPTLAEMTQAALDMLSASEHGFLLQVEGGRVDHAAHINDAPATLWDQLAFDDAIATVLAFTHKYPDTLVIITSDHGCANPGLNGVGSGYRDSQRCFERLAGAATSYARLIDKLRQPQTKPASATDHLPATLQSCFGLPFSDEEVETIRAAVDDSFPPELSNHHRNAVGTLGQIIGNQTGVGWTSVSHTQDATLLTAFGPGADAFRGLLKHTDAFERLTTLLGIKHRNPSMTAEQAGPHLARAPLDFDDPPHWA